MPQEKYLLVRFDCFHGGEYHYGLLECDVISVVSTNKTTWHYIPEDCSLNIFLLCHW
jgi:hypothetical protein